MTKNIGGFFGLELPGDGQEHSVWSLWDMPGATQRLFFNARSALNYFLEVEEPKTLWLPAYCCASLAEAAVGTASRLRFYPIDESLSPDGDFLKRHVEAGDAVLAIDYFGYCPSLDFLALVAQMPDVHWIEDRAQALHPASKAWGAALLYSPRKLLGVPDGGILMGATYSWPAPAPAARVDIDFMKASLMRFLDEHETYSNKSYAAYVESENAMRVEDGAMSRLSRSILMATDYRPLVASRRANYNYLAKHLPDVALLPAAARSDGAPFGFPIRVTDRKKAAAYLHANSVFAAHHWPDMPSDASEFVFEHELAQHMLTLPVDHRYGLMDMQRVVDMLREAL